MGSWPAVRKLFWSPVMISNRSQGRHVDMTPADLTLIVFTLCNSLRVLAYVPQIRRAAKDRSGAEAISFTTWARFVFSNMSAVAYALVNTQDWTMAVAFTGNALGCGAILVIAAWKRSRHRGEIEELTA